MSKDRQRRKQEEVIDDQQLQPIQKVRSAPLEPKTETQKRYIAAIKHFDLTFGIGPAGTGKTYICGALAAEALQNKRTERIIITRPAVEAGEELGFLPGEVADKYGPYIAPFRDVLNERMGKGFVDYLIKSGRIEASPFAYMRGRTFKDAFVILDEAQNATPEQMKLFLTRIGENCKVVVNGDETQRDIRGPSGLSHALSILGYIPRIKVIRFNTEDVVRSGLVAEICEAYERAPA